MQEKMGSSRDGLCSAAAIHHTDGPRGCGERAKKYGEGLEKKTYKNVEKRWRNQLASQDEKSKIRPAWRSSSWSRTRWRCASARRSSASRGERDRVRWQTRGRAGHEGNVAAGPDRATSG